MLWTKNEKEMAIASEKLNRIIKAVTAFTEETQIHLAEFHEILQEMEEFKAEINQEKRNSHYLDCVWSDVNCKAGPDTCRCHLWYWKPQYFIDLIVDLIGEEYILCES